jgi:hypothetical protein
LGQGALEGLEGDRGAAEFGDVLAQSEFAVHMEAGQGLVP